jgi:hypothetical protein
MKAGSDKKLNNLMDFEDFEKTWNPEEQKKTKRTETGLDVIKEELTPETLSAGNSQGAAWNYCKDLLVDNVQINHVRKETGPDMKEMHPTYLEHMIVDTFKAGVEWAQKNPNKK